MIHGLRALAVVLLCSHSPVPATGPAIQGAPEGFKLVQPRQRAPEIGLQDMGGKTHRLAGYAGRVLVVNFWATWCPPCRKEMPSLNRAAYALGAEKVRFVGVNIGETAGAVTAFLQRYRVDFPVLLDTRQEVVRRWPVLGLPTTVIVDPDGNIAYKVAGDREWDAPEIIEAIRALAGPQG